MWSIGTLALILAAGAAERPRLIVMDFTAGGGVPGEVARSLSEAAASSLARTGYFDVVSSKDVQTLLSVERQRQTLGCAAEGTQCLAELAGAMGARFVLSGSVTRLGDVYQLNMQMLDSARAVPAGRSTRLSKDLAALRSGLPYSLAEATATPAPPAPSKLLPLGVIGAGALALGVSAVVGLNALIAEGSATRELALGEANSAVLRPYAAYVADRDAARLQKTAALGGLALGAAVVGLGIWLWPSDSGSSGIALIPTSGGMTLAFSGGWR